MFESPAAFGINATDDDIAECKALEDELMQDTMQNIPHIITTCSNTADTILTKTKKPRVIILEEARSAQELETLIAWAHNSSTMMLIVFGGDPIQLPTMVKTRHMNTADKAINPFAPQRCMSFFERLQRLYYGGWISNGKGTAIPDRPKAQEAIKLVQKVHGVHDEIPHVCLYVPTGVCMRSEIAKSRRSPHHQAKLEELTEEERSATIALEPRHDKDLQGAFDCCGKKGVIVLVEPENHDEAKLVDLSAAEHFRRKLEAIHRGEPICRQE
ncbi:hypothetical protein ABVK25_001733 [Lepraria finkii]|uniref:DNA2/NAM7 helicase helicase domain-containing protein n=1 Tax=Lepraria finkii TaxID=1340010 RepID=A0ABR4BJX4_9LECA